MVEYNDVILGSYGVHTHTDEIRIFYDSYGTKYTYRISAIIKQNENFEYFPIHLLLMRVASHDALTHVCVGPK